MKIVIAALAQLLIIFSWFAAVVLAAQLGWKWQLFAAVIPFVALSALAFHLRWRAVLVLLIQCTGLGLWYMIPIQLDFLENISMISGIAV